MMLRMKDDVENCKRRLIGGNEYEWQFARFLDVRKAYSNVSNPDLWRLLERYGLNGKCLDILNDLHESTECKVSGK